MTTTEKKPRVRTTKKKLALRLEVGDVFINAYEQSDGKIGVALETVTEIVSNEAFQAKMTIRTAWRFAKDLDGTSERELRRFDDVTVL